uniref:PLAT domain-containing protein n=1 Tax=Oryzias sinensis TaxID=183150 RepID=A0A8C7WX43_9TELE
MTVEYQVTVSTEDVAFAGTIDDVYITLVGQDGSSEQVKLPSPFRRGDVSRKNWFVFKSLLEIQLEKWGWIIIQDSWLPAKVEVESPDGKVYSFPIYHWLTDSKKHFFREGTGLYLSHRKCLLADGWTCQSDFELRK